MSVRNRSDMLSIRTVFIQFVSRNENTCTDTRKSKQNLNHTTLTIFLNETLFLSPPTSILANVYPVQAKELLKADDFRTRFFCVRKI